mgnify:CR=1 FL=1
MTYQEMLHDLISQHVANVASLGAEFDQEEREEHSKAMWATYDAGYAQLCKFIEMHVSDEEHMK